MKRLSSCLNQDFFVAVLAGGVAVGLLLDSWSGVFSNRTEVFDARDVVLTVVLALAVVGAHKFPIHFRLHTKVYMNSVPLYLLVVLVPVPLALLAIGAGTLAGQLWVRRERGSLWTDIVIATARWVIVGFFAAQVAHLPLSGRMMENLVLLGTAFALFVGDMLTVSLHIALISREPWGLILLSNLREAFVIEAMQYLMGMLGAIAATQQAWSLVLLALPLAFSYLAFKNTTELRDGTRRMLESLADAVDLRDSYTGGHSARVASLVRSTLQELGIRGPEADLICVAARLHDIGKIGIPDAMLQKPTSLALPEWQVMRMHPERGAVLLSRYADFARGTDFIRYHHEYWDGSGYPRGLKGFDIPFGARVIAVADAFDAMTSNRPYRRAMTVERAMWELRAGRGKQWDPAVVDAFLRVIARRLERAERLKTQPLGVPASASE